jgi:periplasmic serine protease DO-like
MEMQIRHNNMDINSFRAFMQVRGGFTAGRRDVYFIRFLGYESTLVDELTAADNIYNDAGYKGGIVYRYIDRLPLPDKTETDFYLEIYEKWVKETKQTQGLKLKCSQNNALLCDALGKALSKIQRIYINEKYGYEAGSNAEKCGYQTGSCMPDTEKEGSIKSDYKYINNSIINDSIIKNFLIKIMKWTDYVLGDKCAGWNEKSSIKVAALDVFKLHEYLFYYFLTFIGVDAALLQVSSDIKTGISSIAAGFSKTVTTGSYSDIKLPVFKRKTAGVSVNEATSPKDNYVSYKGSDSGIHDNSDYKSENTGKKTVTKPRLSLPQRPDRVRREPVYSPAVKAACENQTQKRRELSFEELAKLASSIVLITAYGEKGKPLSLGSGIMIGKDGFILTNYHVISKGVFYSVNIEEDKNVYSTDEIVKYHTVLDLAVIRIRRKLDPLPVCSDEKGLVRGQKVVAIGSPLGFFNSVSDGIISGFRQFEDMDMIQFTAPISSGSSGGALLNMYGEVIGISTAGIDEGQNINLAVSYENINNFAKGFM